jgi:hypothetical protein
LSLNEANYWVEIALQGTKDLCIVIVFICNICFGESQLTSYSQEESYCINSEIGDASSRVQVQTNIKHVHSMEIKWKFVVYKHSRNSRHHQSS